MFKRDATKNFSDTSRFVFDQDMLENYVSYFTPKDNIHIVLGCTQTNLDEFCKACYGCGWDEAYLNLTGLADALARQAVQKLAFMGNQTALKILTEHMMKLDRDEQANTLRVQIVADVPTPDSDNNKKE